MIKFLFIFSTILKFLIIVVGIALIVKSLLKGRWKNSLKYLLYIAGTLILTTAIELIVADVAN